MTVRWITWVGPKGRTVTAHALVAGEKRTHCRLKPHWPTLRAAAKQPKCRRCLQVLARPA